MGTVSGLCRAVALVVAFTPLVPSLYQTGEFQSSGVDITAPVFLEENFTWRFEITAIARPGALVAPLFTNLDVYPTGVVQQACPGYAVSDTAMVGIDRVPVENCPHCLSAESYGVCTSTTASRISMVNPPTDGKVFSVVFWARLTHAVGGAEFVTLRGDSRRLSLRVKGDANSTLELMTVAGNMLSLTPVSLQVPLGVWAHVAVTISWRVARCFLDGAAAPPVEILDVTGGAFDAVDFFRCDNANMVGSFTDAKMYGRALSAVEVQALTRGLWVSDSALLPLFPCQEAPPAPNPPPMFDRAACTGYVSPCCLTELPTFFVNDEVASFVGHLGSCHPESGFVLQDPPPVTSFMRYTFPDEYDEFPRVWCVSPTTCVYEILAENLGASWLTTESRSADTSLPGLVVNRRLLITTLFAHMTPLHMLEMTLTTHTLVFHDSSSSLRVASNMRHHAFNHFCLGREKPPHSLWRTDIIAANASCTWFCQPGYMLYPSSNDYYFITTAANASLWHLCVPQPSPATILQFILAVHLPPLAANASRAENALHEYLGRAVTQLQAAAALATGQKPRRTTLYLQRYGTPADVMQISMAIFSPDCSQNASRQLERAAAQLQNGSTAELLAALLNVSDTAVTVLDSEATRDCRDASDSMPLLYIILGAVWGVIILILCGVGCGAAAKKAHSGRRKRLYQRVSPLLQAGVVFAAGRRERVV